MTSVLVVEDDHGAAAALTAALDAAGLQVHRVATASAARAAIAAGRHDVVLLDLGLPDVDGLTTLRWLRSSSDVPVLVLSGRDDQDQKIAALDAGADDYITKPFDGPELLARIRAVLRRAAVPASRIEVEDLVIDLERREVRREGRPVRLTPTELGLLTELVTHPGALLAHEQLLRAVWGEGYGTESHYLRVYVAQLRRKLGDDAADPRLIQTEPGLGYRWVAGQD